MAIRGVIFDFNGTLFWDGDKNEAAWRAFALRHAGRTITDQEFLDLHGRPNREFIGFLLGYIPADPADVLALAEEKEEIYREMCLRDPQGFCLAPGAGALLRELQSRHIPHGIATSAEIGNVDFYFQHMGLSRYFERRCVVFNDHSRPGKPHPDFYQAAAQAIGLPPQECAVVEDAPIGVLAAHNAGVGRVVGIVPPGTRLLRDNPYVDVWVQDFTQAQRWLDALKD
ncbi:MAG TPA: HAD family phosphatase [Candidatus Excrementavichristensenella intestinipullorum]|nr:HAD family phosphatase [Candidatus Excrementavichristensenella intestinipullorum]